MCEAKRVDNNYDNFIKGFYFFGSVYRFTGCFKFVNRNGAYFSQPVRMSWKRIIYWILNSMAFFVSIFFFLFFLFLFLICVDHESWWQTKSFGKNQEPWHLLLLIQTNSSFDGFYDSIRDLFAQKCFSIT